MGMVVPESSYADRCKLLAIVYPIVYPIVYRETFNRRKLINCSQFHFRRNRVDSQNPFPFKNALRSAA